MVEFRTSHPIDPFLVNPAFDLDTQLQQSKMVDDNTLYSGGADRHNDDWYNTPKTMTSNGKIPTTAADLVNNNSMALPGYTSEEDTASPIDDDSCSLHSDYSDIRNFTFPEALAGGGNKVEQQCNRAQAVKIQSAGKAKVVSLPKLGDIPSRRGLVRSASIQHRRKSSSGRNSTEQTHSGRSSQDSHQGSVNSSVLNSPASTAPSSVITEKSIQVKRRSSIASRHVPLMEAARAISPTSSAFTSTPNTPIEPRSTKLMKRESTTSSHRSNSTTSSLKHPIKRKNKLSLSSNFSLNRISREFRDSFAPKDAARGSHLEDRTESEPVTVTRQAPRSASAGLSKPKMVARAANERAPTIEVPPFPGENDDFATHHWPLRMASVSNRVASMA